MLRLPILILIYLITFTTPSVATDKVLSDEQLEQFSQRWDTARQRLNLTEEQEEQVKPILKENSKQRRAMLQRYGIHQGQAKPALSFSQKRSLLKESRALKNETNSKVGKILSEEQMVEYKKIQDEARTLLKEKMRK